jgi:hypothetical protein
MTNLTYVTEATDLDVLFAPYANKSTFSDKAMDVAAKQLTRAIAQNKPVTIVPHYRAKLASRAAEILLLIPAEEHVLLMWNKETHSMVLEASKAWKKANKIAIEDAEFDALMADIPFNNLPYNRSI